MGIGDDDSPFGKSSAADSSFGKFAMSLFKIVDGPVTFVKEKVVEPLQSKNNNKYFHRRYPRVKTIDQCEVEDPVCIYEAHEQFRRDKQIDSNIVKILRQRRIECMQWEGPDYEYKCKKIVEDYEEAATNWFIKYGDIGANGNVIDAYMKQKHRLLWHRRYPDKPLM